MLPKANEFIISVQARARASFPPNPGNSSYSADTSAHLTNPPDSRLDRWRDRDNTTFPRLEYTSHPHARLCPLSPCA